MFFCRLHLEEVFVAQAAGGLAAAAFLGAQDAEVDAGGFQQLSHRLGYFGAPFLQGAGAAHPEEDVHFLVLSQNLDPQTLAQSVRDSVVPRQGWPRSSMLRSAPSAVSGMDACSITRFRLRSTILSMWSTHTGQMTSQAPQVVQAQISSRRMTLSTRGTLGLPRGASPLGLPEAASPSGLPWGASPSGLAGLVYP